jgi:ribosomal protein L11 methyltransferase
LFCTPDQVEGLATDLWEFGTAGIRELDRDNEVTLIAGFETNENRAEMLRHFAAHSPTWEQEEAIDWVEHTHATWQPREVGERVFLALPWTSDPTPAGRVRVVHNPGLACGTGEHPCTQLALAAIEGCVFPGCTVADIGTGSGILAIAATRLGAARSVGTDIDEAALHAAQENYGLNELAPALAVGSADCLRTGSSDITVANISATVLLGIMDDLMRVTKPQGRLILTGFPEWELFAIASMLPRPEVTGINEWRCVVASVS